MAYFETDPLLPKDKPAPEIQGSRPQSINDVLVGEYMAWDVDDRPGPRDQLADILEFCGNILRLFLGILIVFFLFSLALLISDGDFNSIWDDNPWSHRTIDQRAHNILTQNPLIGSESCFVEEE